MIRIGAASKETNDHQTHPTGAGLLMFGEEYLITPQYPEYFLDFREKLDPGVRWTDRVQTNDGEWSGNAFDFFTKVYKKLTADFKVPFMTEGNGSPYRTEETPKHLAVREAIANCLANADFFQRGGVVIERYPDRIELSNPGTIILGKKQMLHGGLSEPRNKNILKMFNLIGVGEHAGSGVPDIFEAWKNEKLQEPIVEENFGTEIGDRTKVTLPLVKMGATTSSAQSSAQSSDLFEKGRKKGRKQDEIKSRAERILTIIKENPDITQVAIAAQLGISEKQVRTAFDLLKAEYGVAREGGHNNGRWIVREIN